MSETDRDDGPDEAPAEPTTIVAEAGVEGSASDEAGVEGDQPLAGESRPEPSTIVTAAEGSASVEAGVEGDQPLAGESRPEPSTIVAAAEGSASVEAGVEGDQPLAGESRPEPSTIVAAAEGSASVEAGVEGDQPLAEETRPEPSTIMNGQEVVHVSRERYLDLVKELADEGYVMCVDLTAVDYLEHMERPLPAGVVGERFEVVVNLLDMVARRRIRIRVQAPEDDPVVASLFDVHPGAEAMEREVFDMFGVSFEGHPDLTRILMPEDWDGHPLRKDYDVGRIPVQFKEVHA